MFKSVRHNGARESEAVQPFPIPGSFTLVLDANQRRLEGVEMPPLLNGEFALLSFLGLRPFTWYLARELSLSVYGREDAAACQLVWKYASTLREKLTSGAPGLIDSGRQGYRCQAQLVIIDEDGVTLPPIPGMPR
jgi:DNA-binding response OmpR family regulator